jgi:hypothetical protein
LLVPSIAALALLVSPARAATTSRCSGLQCTIPPPSSSSVSSPDGRALHLSLAGDSHDAVSVAVDHSSGVTLECAQPWPSSPVSLSMEFSTTAVSVTGTATVAHSYMFRLERVGLQLQCSSDWSSHCSDGSCSSVTRLLYHQGHLLGSTDVPVSSSFTLLDGPAGPPAIPSVSFECDRVQHSMVSVLSFSSSCLYVVGGSSVLVDRVVTSCMRQNEDAIDELSRCDVTCPVTGGMSSLDFSSLSFVRDGYNLALTDFTADGHPDVLSLSSSSPTSVVTATATWVDRVYGGGGGGGGCGGGVCTPLSELDSSCPPASMDLSLRRVLNWTPIFDEMADFTVHVQVKDSFGNNRDGASMTCVLNNEKLHIDGAMLGAPPESLRVLSHGTEVGRYAWTCTPVSCALDVSATPGGSPQMSISSAGACSAGWDLGTNKKLVTESGDAGGATSSSSVLTCSDLGMHVTFADQRVFLVGGSSVTGDELQFKSSCSSSGGEVITIVGTSFELGRSSSATPGASVLEVTGFSSSHKDQVVAHVVGAPALSSTVSSVDVALDLERASDHSSARGVSVSVLLTSNLVLLGDTEYDLFSRFGPTQRFTTPEGNNLYTFDLALLGGSCGPTGDGRFCTLQIGRAPGAPDGLGFVTVTHTELASCPGPPLPCDAGSRAVVVLDASTVCAASTVTATTLRAGNDADGTAKIVLDWMVDASCPVSGASVELYRAPYGDYPFYASGSTAPLPASYPPPAPWTRVALQCSGGAAGTASQCTDEPSSRDCYTFSLVVIDRFGNRSPFIQTDACRTNYFLGDVTNGVTQCSGDNADNTADIAALGAHYGVQVPLGSPLGCLDVGPTLDRTVFSRPTPDHKLSFADLILYAIDYLTVSRPEGGPRPAAAVANALALDVPRLPGVGGTFDVTVRMSGAGDVQGLSIPVGYDPAVVEMLGVNAGDLLSRQGRGAVVLSSGPGDVDAALLGEGAGIAGEGELARVTFRVRAAGDPALSLGTVVARDVRNGDVNLTTGAPAIGTGRTALRLAFPNPFERSTTVVFSLHATGPADVGVYDVAGRHVRTLLRGVQPAGEHTLAWDGTDDSGTRLNAGVYMLRLDAGGHSETRALRLVK